MVYLILLFLSNINFINLNLNFLKLKVIFFIYCKLHKEYDKYICINH